MAETFIPASEAKRRYYVADLRTLKSRARNGEILYQVINPESKRPRWLFETPEARYARTMGTLLTN